MINPNDDTPDNPLPPLNPPSSEGDLVVLEDMYEPAFLGASFSVTEPPRVAYSLPRLATIEREHLECSVEEAQKSIMGLMQVVTQKHGNRAPLFIDVSQNLNPKKEKPRIIRP